MFETTCVLEARGLHISFGGLTAVKHFSIALKPGEIVGLIGPNGAGKTTVFNLLTGIYQPDKGTIAVNGQILRGDPGWKVTRKGLCRTFQNLRLFQSRTVLENLLIASHAHVGYSAWDAVFRTPKFSRRERELREQCLDILAHVNLRNKAGHRSTDLSYGEMRRLEIARALATGPNVLLLDEPAAGMNAKEGEALLAMIRKIRETFGLTILLIEHNMNVVMNLCMRVIVLDYGEIIAEGSPDHIRSNLRVIEAYLGEAEDHVDH